MTHLKVLVVLFFNFFLLIDCDVTDVERLLKNDYEPSVIAACNKVANARIDYHMDIMNEHKMQAYINSIIEAIKIKNDLNREISRHDMPIYIDSDILKILLDVTGRGLSLSSDEEIKDFVEKYVLMDKEFNTAKICPFNKPKCDLAKKGIDLYEIEETMANSTSYTKLLYMWREWRNVTVKVKKVFVSLLSMENVSARAKKGKIPQIIDDSLRLWKQVEPLYLELHNYVSRKLKAYYGDELDVSDGLLPAHVLGSVWADSWYHIEHLVRPFPNVSDGNLEDNLRRRFQVEDMFKAADEFFQSLDLVPMESAYKGPRSMITKPTDGRVVACSISSADDCNGTYSVTACGRVDLENYISFHHELGRIQYFIQYKDLPYSLRDSASLALHESIGQSVALSAISPRHLEELELLNNNYRVTYETSINHLMKIALIKVASLPFQLIAGLWKLEITSEKSNSSEWNSLWWEYRKKYQKIKAPISRLNVEALDPISKYSITMKTDFLPQFQARIMEFQVYKSFCLMAQDFDPVQDKTCPLFNCDFYKSKPVGIKLRESLGSDYIKNWESVLDSLTGYPKVTADPLLDYFQPLYEYLKEENRKALPDVPPPPPAPLSSHHIAAIVISVICIVLGILILFLYVKFTEHGAQCYQGTIQILSQMLPCLRRPQDSSPEEFSL